MYQILISLAYESVPSCNRAGWPRVSTLVGVIDQIFLISGPPSFSWHNTIMYCHKPHNSFPTNIAVDLFLGIPYHHPTSASTPRVRGELSNVYNERSSLLLLLLAKSWLEGDLGPRLRSTYIGDLQDDFSTTWCVECKF